VRIGGGAGDGNMGDVIFPLEGSSLGDQRHNERDVDVKGKR
jgi:hypothetical protein